MQVFNFTRMIERSTPIFTSVEEQFSPRAYKLFPNPSSGRVTLTVPANQGNSALTLYTVNGAKLLTRNISGLENSIHIDGLKQGIYLLKINSDDGSVTQKLIVH